MEAEIINSYDFIRINLFNIFDTKAAEPYLSNIAQYISHLALAFILRSRFSYEEILRQK